MCNNYNPNPRSFWLPIYGFSPYKSPETGQKPPYSTSRKVADHFAMLSALSSEMLTGHTIWISQMQSVPSLTVT